jgi:DegV family protein with EDD domain
MKIAISAETTIDLPEELLKQYDIQIVPFSIIMGDDCYLDGQVHSKDLFDFVDRTKKLPKTSAVNQYQYEEHFNKIKSEGCDAIIHFSLSSKISSACQNAKEVAGKMENVHVIDTLSLSTGIALQAIYASKLVKAGYPLDKILSLIEERLPSVQASFSLESVNFLYLGGRCSMLKMLGANVLHLKPAILVKNGSMEAGKKYRGNMMRAVQGYVDDILNEFDNPDKAEVFITYSSAPDDVVEMVRGKLKEKGFENIHTTLAGGTISCHCGPNCLGILYYNDGPHII